MKYVLSVSICLFTLLLVGCSKTIKEPEYMIFSASYFGITDVTDTNAAILITDKDSIKYIKNLFFDNGLESACLCGYDYRIQFLDEKGNSVENNLYYPINVYSKNDRKIKEEVKALSFRMHNYPTHYIYNVEIEGDPYSALKKMRANGFLAFMMNDEDHLSTVQVLYNNDFKGLEKELSQFSFIKKLNKALDSLTIKE